MGLRRRVRAGKCPRRKIGLTRSLHLSSRLVTLLSALYPNQPRWSGGAKDRHAAHSPDESVPAGLRRLLSDFDVKTVPEMGWAGISNGRLLDEAGRVGFDVLVTAD